MAISYIGPRGKHILNHYRSKRIADGILLTNDYGSWVFLNEEEFQNIRSKKVTEPLFSLLRDKGFVIDHDNLDQVIKDHRKKCEYLFQGTSLHIVVPTLRCNLRCIYCHANARPIKDKGYDMSKETAKKTIDLIFQAPSQAITIEFQGGEPLLNFEIVKFMVEYANDVNSVAKKDLRYSLVTNLTMMTPEILAFLKQKKVGICSSLDGPALVHNKNRQEYEKTEKWIKKIVKEYHLQCMLLVTKHSIGLQKEIVDSYFKLGLDRIWIKAANNLGFAQGNWSNAGVTATEFLGFWKEALDYIILKNRERLLLEQHTKILLHKILTKDCVNFTDLESPCGAAIGQLAYDYDGSVYSCDEGRQYDVFKLGTVDDTNSEIVTCLTSKSILRASLNDNPICEMCAYKPFCGLCPVCAYAERGNIISDLPDRRCDIYMGMFDYIFEKTLTDSEFRDTTRTWLQKNI